MRRARREDVWRNVGETWKGDLALAELRAHGVPGFADVEIELSGGIAVLCGQNGSGKSRTLRRISRRAHGMEDAGILDLVLRKDDATLSVADPEIAVEVIDTAWLVQLQQVSLASDANLQDRLDQVDAARLSNSELALVQYLLGRDFSSVEILEIEATEEELPALRLLRDRFGVGGVDEEFLPYFRVEYEGHTLESLDLSLGELAGLTLFWALRRAPRGSLVLIEEPDTFLSPLSASRSLDVVASFAVRNNTPTLVTSHSHLGLVRVPPPHLLVLTSAGGDTALSAGTPYSVWTALRITPQKRIFLVVEDEAARQWLEALLAQLDLPWLDEVQVVKSGEGAGGVRNASRFPSCDPHVVTIIGVLDGDERDDDEAAAGCIFLPGTEPPEALILEALRSTTDDGFMGFSKDRVDEALRLSEGNDPHERIAEIATTLGVQVATLRRHGLVRWVETNEGQQYLAEFSAAVGAITVPGAADRP